MTYDNLVTALKEKSNEKTRAFSTKIVNTPTPILGLKTADIVAIRKRFLAETSFPEILALPSNAYYEVDMIKGTAIAAAKIPTQKKFDLLREFAATIDNWAVCDSVSCTITVDKADNEKLWDFALSLLSDDRTFVIRFGVDVMMDKFIDEKHIDQIFKQIDGLKFGEYYLDMGVAWLLSVTFVKFRDKTVEYINGKNNLTKFVRNKALQKVRESFRVSDEDKEMAKNMKI